MRAPKQVANLLRDGDFFFKERNQEKTIHMSQEYRILFSVSHFFLLIFLLANPPPPKKTQF